LKIAFLGTGNMGEPMALNLLRAGHDVVAYNRTTGKLAPLAAAGAHIAHSPAGAVEDVDVVITMLANDQAVRDAMLGTAIEALPAGAVHMGTSTISIGLSKELATEHARHGQHYIATPVLGRPDAARDKRLWVMAAGPPDQIERCRPLMEAIGRGITVVGPEPWQANVTKIGANFMIMSMLEAMGESFALVRKSGIDPHLFLEILTGIFNSPVYSLYGKIIADRQFEPAGFRLALGMKDAGLALDAGQGAAVPMPLASLIHDHFLSAIAHGRGDADWAALAEVAARDAGIADA
jgi:3-hydroxyisobutyrate dehydrogenase-like beta-hydroxyacid dehydrogenase